MPFPFKNHKELEGRHSVLSPSKYSWIRYSAEKFAENFREMNATTYGSRLHELAKEHILLGILMPRNEKTLNKYINDMIGMRMTPEVVLAFNGDSFGSADAIKFDAQKLELTIADLKTGTHEASFDQLYIYVVYFCLEYGYRIGELNKIELRIYQNDEVRIEQADLEKLGNIHGKVLEFNEIMSDIRREQML